MASHRGKHRRPSKAAAVVTTAGAAIPAGLIIASSVNAQAATLPGPVPSVQDTHPLHFISTTVIRPATPAVYTVQAGDYLSKIAKARCGNPADWTGIWAKNKAKIPNPNVIFPKQQLVIDCRTAPVPVISAPAPVRVSQAVTTASPAGGNVNPNDYSGFQQCVISRESGGRSQVMNSSGHYGLYQFSASTWEAYGGSAADFGHASVAEQNRVFANAMAQGGESNWSPYDGC